MRHYAVAQAPIVIPAYWQLRGNPLLSLISLG
jgi:hypothetical protein